MKRAFPGSTCWIDGRESQEVDEHAVTLKDLHLRTVMCILSTAVEFCIRNESPVVYVDACSCGKAGKLIVAVFMDMDHHIQPIGCYFVGEETDINYSLFFSELLNAGLNRKEHIAIMSDGALGIKAAFDKVFADLVSVGRAIHIGCSEHEKRNITDYMHRALNYDPRNHEDSEKVRRIHQLFYCVRNASNDTNRVVYMAEIFEIDERVGDYIVGLGDSNYVSHLPFPVFSQQSNNPCESMMSRLKLKENEGRAVRYSDLFNVFQRFVLVAVKFMDTRYNSLDLHPVREGEVEYPDPVYCSFVVRSIIRLGCIYEVFKDKFEVQNNTVFDYSWYECFTVDLERRECTCLSFQQNKYPCIHAIAILHERRQFGSVFSYVDDCYKRRSISKTCMKVPTETWQLLEFDHDRDYDVPVDIDGYEEDSITWTPWGQVNTKNRIHSRGEDSSIQFSKTLASIKASNYHARQYAQTAAMNRK